MRSKEVSMLGPQVALEYLPKHKLTAMFHLTTIVGDVEEVADVFGRLWTRVALHATTWRSVGIGIVTDPEDTVGLRFGFVRDRINGDPPKTQ
jgi:hypothetical protein